MSEDDGTKDHQMRTWIRDRLGPKAAMRIADLHMRHFPPQDGWEGARAVAAYPMSSPDDLSLPAYWEVKFANSSRPDAGYVVVATTIDRSPIPCFATEGPTHTERLRNRVGATLATVVWRGPSYQTAHDAAGEVIAALGRPPQPAQSELGAVPACVIKPRGADRVRLELELQSKEPGHDLKWRRLLCALPPYAREASFAYSLRGGTSSGSGSGVQSIDSYEHYFIGYAEGWVRQAAFDQIDANSAPNNTNHASGCGPTAWAALLAYDDLHWDPDLLYGTWQTNLDYVGRLIMVLHNRLGTSNLGGAGYTDRANMERGYSVMQDHLGHGRNVDLSWFAWSDAPWSGNPSEEVKSFAFDMIYLNHLPCIVGYRTEATGGHYALGFQIAIQRWYAVDGQGGYQVYETDEPSTADAGSRGGWVRVNNLWGDWPGDVKWIDIDEVFGVWAIHPGTYACPQQRIVGYSSSFDMGQAAVADRFCVTWRSDGTGYINIAAAPASGIPIPTSGNTISGIAFDQHVILRQFVAAGAVDAHGCILTPPTLPSGCLSGIMRWFGGIRWLLGFLPPVIPFAPPSVETLLFIAWRDVAKHIHIAFTDVRALDKESFTEVTLPDRFLTEIDPAIAIASQDPVGPILYIAFGNVEGQLVAVSLDTFFRIAREGVDHWPQDFGSDLQTSEEWVDDGMMGPYLRRQVTHLTRLWMSFTLGRISHVRLASSGAGVAIAWIRPEITTGSGGVIELYRSFAFDGSWGDTSLLQVGNWDWDVSGADTSARPACWLSDSGYLVLAWRGSGNRILLATVSGRGATLQAHLFDTASSGPALQCVTDAQMNSAVVLGWFGTDGGRSMNHRMAYITPPIFETVPLPR